MDAISSQSGRRCARSVGRPESVKSYGNRLELVLTWTPGAPLGRPHRAHLPAADSPVRRLLNPIARFREQPISAMQGQTTDAAPTIIVTHTALR